MIGNINKDQLAMILGGLAQATMAKTKDGDKSWQSMAGQLGQGLGQAGQLGTQLNKQRAEQTAFRNAVLQSMLGRGQEPQLNPQQIAPQQGLTPDGVPGPTSFSTTHNADGTTKTVITGNEAKPGVNAPMHLMPLKPTPPAQVPKAPQADTGFGPFAYNMRDIFPFS